MEIKLTNDAFALRCVRARKKQNDFVFYEAVTFPENPSGICAMYLRRAHIAGGLEDDGNSLVIDVLDKNGDVIQDYPISRKAFEYLRSRLKFRVTN